MSKRLISVKFEVFGKVQRVFFRKYTHSQAEALGLRGFCLNTDAGTVRGVMEGPEPQVELMKDWLRTTGSPKSVIEKAVFTDEKEIATYSYASFDVRR